ncbi:MAG: hypothetical protein AAFV88_00840 [Planctomycetota bacterium]
MHDRPIRFLASLTATAVMGAGLAVSPAAVWGQGSAKPGMSFPAGQGSQPGQPAPGRALSALPNTQPAANASAAVAPPSQFTPRALENAPDNRGFTAGGNQPRNSGTLPQEAGQYWVDYDLRPYTGYLQQHDHPEQAIVDWVLRETGTDVWFTAPFGVLNANRDKLSV